jgi:hypothetical protein
MGRRYSCRYDRRAGGTPGDEPEIGDAYRHNGNVNNWQRRSLDYGKLHGQGGTSPNVTVK